MSLLDRSLKELGVPEVCCALQCFPLEGFGEKRWIYYCYQGISCSAPVWAGNKWVVASLFGWEGAGMGGGKGVRPLGLDSWDHACMFQAQNSANPMLNLWNRGGLEGNVKDGKKGWKHFSSNWIWNTIQRQHHCELAGEPWSQVWLQGGAVFLCLYSMFIMYLMNSGFAFNLCQHFFPPLLPNN